MVVQNARDGQGQPLSKGQIQLQSEAAEYVYKDMKIRTICELPAAAAALIKPLAKKGATQGKEEEKPRAAQVKPKP